MFAREPKGFASHARRATGLFLAVTVGYSAAPVGFNAIFGSASDFVENEVRKIQGYPGPFADRPIKPRPMTAKIGRSDILRGGIRNEQEFAALMRAEAKRFERRAARNPELLSASLAPQMGGMPPPGGAENGEGMGGQENGVGFQTMHENGGPTRPMFWGGNCAGWVPGMGRPCMNGFGDTDGLGGPGGGGGGGAGGGTGGGGTVDVNTGRIHLNANTGNLVTTVGITGWSAKGDSYIDFTLVHNSRQSQTLGAVTDIGHSWTHNYSIEVFEQGELSSEWPPNYGTVAYLIWIDGQRIKFTYHGTVESPGARFDPPAGYHAYIYKTSTGEYILKTKDQWTYSFNSDGMLVEQTDPWGNDVTINRDGNNKITTVSDGLGRSLTFTYDGTKISHVEAPDGKTWEFVRGDGSNLTKIKYPELGSTVHETNFTYNSTNDILSYTNTLGKTWDYTYLSDGKLSSVTNPLDRTWSVMYYEAYVQIYNPYNQYVQHNYQNGRLVSYRDEAAYVVNFWADSDENLTQVQDKRGEYWTWDYDSNGNMTAATDPNGREWEYTYNSHNNLTSVKDPTDTTVVAIAYDSGSATLPAPTSVDDPLYSPLKRYTYSSTGELLGVWLDNPGGTTYDENLSAYTYDSYKNVTEVEDPRTGITVSATYDILGRPLTVTDSAGETTSMFYDDWGRPYELELPDASTVEIEFNHGSQVVSATDQLGRSGSVAYNDAGMVTSATNAKSETHTFGYDYIGRLTTVTNARGKTRSYTYTVRHEVYTLTLPDSSTESWAYDANGNVASYTNALLQTVSYAYNDSGDQTAVDYPTGTDTSFGYDSVGRWVSMTDATGTSEWVFNTVGQVTELTTPQGGFEYSYNTWGQPYQMTDSSGTWTTLYDQYHRAYGMTNPWSETTTVAFDSAGRVDRKDLPNGMYETYTFDDRSRLTHVRTYDSSDALQDTKQYTWDAASRITSAVEGGVTTSYGYDLIDQLTSESRTGYSAAYTYDANGNRLTRTVNSVTEDYAYDDADKLLTVSINSAVVKEFSYDAAGRTTAIETSAGTTAFAYDYDGRATAITYPNATSDSHTYNALGARVGSSGANGSKTFRRAGIGVTSSVLDDGSRKYTPGVSSRSGSTSTFQHSGLKNATEQSSSSQSVSASRQYDAFGNVTNSSGTWQGPFGYAGSYGYQEDANGLKLLGHRYYDPSTGRFLTADPIGDGSNWYVYTGNNPVCSVDPEGLQAGKGQNRGRGDDWLYGLSNEALRELLRDADPQLKKRILRILKERGERNKRKRGNKGSKSRHMEQEVDPLLVPESPGQDFWEWNWNRFRDGFRRGANDPLRPYPGYIPAANPSPPLIPIDEQAGWAAGALGVAIGVGIVVIITRGARLPRLSPTVMLRGTVEFF